MIPRFLRPLLGLLVAALVAPVFMVGCQPPPRLPPQTDGSFPQPLRYDTFGAATLQIDDLRLTGDFWLVYSTLPGNEVAISEFKGEIADRVVTRDRLLGRDVRVPLRCNRTWLDHEAAGALVTPERMEFSRGAVQVRGLSFAKRALDGSCPGRDEVRRFEASNSNPASGSHRPGADEFALSTPFDVDIDGDTYSGSLELSGTYSNRPPVARIGSAALSSHDNLDGGCPPVESQSLPGLDWVWPERPEIKANLEDGLAVLFRSASWDPDGEGIAVVPNTGPRVDIEIEQWAHWNGSEYRHLGRGYEVGPIIFEKDVLHRVLLTVIDSKGARSQAECRFFVVD